MRPHCRRRLCPFVGAHPRSIRSLSQLTSSTQDSHLACVPRIVLAMGARLVVAAKRSHAHKTSEIRDPKPDPNREFGHNTQFDLIILKNKDDLGQISIPLNSVHAKVEDWHWVTDCLIARNQF